MRHMSLLKSKHILWVPFLEALTTSLIAFNDKTPFATIRCANTKATSNDLPCSTTSLKSPTACHEYPFPMLELSILLFFMPE